LPSEYFDAALTLNAVQKYQCTGLYGVTTMFIDQLSHPDFAQTEKSSLRYKILSCIRKINEIDAYSFLFRFGLMAGSAMPEDLLLRVINKFPIREIYTNWGMTELSSIATMTSANDPILKKQKTAGKLLPNLTAKIVAPNTGNVLPWGARGEIVVSGFSVMHSYFEDVERTRGSIKHHTENGETVGLEPTHHSTPRRWMHTGDEGYLDEDGYLVVTGRIKDLIIRGGENIAPMEIEERLFKHPAIKQACVFGIPNERYGEVVAAFLELEDGSARPDDETVREWVRGALSRFKVPVRIWWLGDIEKGCPAEWPKTANGKLRKKDIREIGASKRPFPPLYVQWRR
jgi:acyl-CoA synthetase (AMP-forming)/AMP-acid ligase II